MVSKKVLGPALAGTGAVGATGSLAWALGLFDGENLENNQKESVAPPKQPAASKGPQTHSASLQRSSAGGWERRVITSLKIPGAAATSDYFTKGTATEEDKQAINSELTWKVEWLSGFESLWIKVVESENNTLWECRLRHTSIKKIDSEDNSNSELLRQGGDLIEAIKNNNTHKEKFVENCSKAKWGGETYGVIELEVEKDSKGKVIFKESNGYFQKLWTENFTGLDKLLSSDDEKLLKEITGWNIEEIKEAGDKTKKIKISLKNNKSWFCSISGNYSGNLGAKKFKAEDFINEILDSNRNIGYQNEVEWKKYLFRNCKKHKNEITGLTVRAAGRNEWEFKDLKKITEDMYSS